MTTTREEWAALQSSGPTGLRALLYQIAENRRREEEEAAQRRADLDAEIDRRRFAFETALTAQLASEGGEWLSDYRVPESAIPNLLPIGLQTPQHVAEFDPRAVGLHRLRAELWYPDRETEWRFANWFVLHPQQPRTRPTLIEAIEIAASYSDTPF